MTTRVAWVATASRRSERTAARLGELGLRVQTEVCEGHVAEAILDYADSKHADLIAMSTHGRSGLGRLLMGSVAEKVMHSTKVPVLLVHPVHESPAAHKQ